MMPRFRIVILHALRRARLSAWNDDAGASMVEYALMMALVALVVSLAAARLGLATTSTFSTAAGVICGNGKGNSGNGGGNCGGDGSNSGGS